MAITKEYHFMANGIYGVGRENPMDLEGFLKEMKELFEKHEVKYIEGGVIGNNKDGLFGISGAKLNISGSETVKPLSFKG